MTRSAYVLACVLACLAGGHAVPFDCQTMTHLGLPSGCLLGLKTASYGTLAVCKDVLCKKLLTDTGGNAEWIINPNGGCSLTPRGAASVQDLICVSSSAVEPNPPAPESEGGGITGGGVFLILFFVGGFVYFAGGMAYNFKVSCTSEQSHCSNEGGRGEGDDNKQPTTHTHTPSTPLQSHVSPHHR